MMKNCCFQLTDVRNMYCMFVQCVWVCVCVYAKLEEFIGVTLNVSCAFSQLNIFEIFVSFDLLLIVLQPFLFNLFISVHYLSKLLFIIDFLFKTRPTKQIEFLSNGSNNNNNIHSPCQHCALNHSHTLSKFIIKQFIFNFINRL